MHQLFSAAPVRAAHKAVDPWPQEEYSEILPRSANSFFMNA
jgi:hypothetical protein